MEEFTTQSNILMLRDIIFENEETRKMDPDYVEQLLARNLDAFHSKHKNSPGSLMHMNMEFLREFLYVADASYNQFIQGTLDTSVNEPNAQITREQIQSSKNDEFNNDLQKLQQDFEQHMKPDIPEEPVFADQTPDDPVDKEALADIMRRTIAERNLEVSQIQTSQAQSTEEAAKWITSTNPSAASAFMETREQPPEIKTIKIQEEAADVELSVETISPLTTRQEKRVTWTDNAQPSNNPSLSIFKKLKQSTRPDLPNIQPQTPPQSQPPDYITRKEFDEEINTMMEFLRERFAHVEKLLTRSKHPTTSNHAVTQTTAPSTANPDLGMELETEPEDTSVD